MNPQPKTEDILDAAAMRDFYDRIYYANASATADIAAHYRRLAKKFQMWKGQHLLDVACGAGQWLAFVAALGSMTAVVDISRKALDNCRQTLPHRVLHRSPAEQLPFADRQFDVISCLGALEHFLDPQAALREMVRVAKPSAVFILLVPNSAFLPLRFGLYAGTQQVDVREEVRLPSKWRELSLVRR